ncbi:hypothetical protein EDC04DRAFT_912217 [Pisolithus marmoratus]|nr:hypothetical protein EDC04DRAFT_912217 [Pisolithus marmoratus]
MFSPFRVISLHVISLTGVQSSRPWAINSSHRSSKTHQRRRADESKTDESYVYYFLAMLSYFSTGGVVEDYTPFFVLTRRRPKPLPVHELKNHTPRDHIHSDDGIHGAYPQGGKTLILSAPNVCKACAWIEGIAQTVLRRRRGSGWLSMMREIRR